MDINYDELKNSSFPIMLWHINDKEEDEVMVYAGKAIYDVELNMISIYYNDNKKPVFVLEEEDFGMIQKVENDEIKKILLGADYAIKFNLYNLPEDVQKDKFRMVEGLKWYRS